MQETQRVHAKSTRNGSSQGLLPRIRRRWRQVGRWFDVRPWRYLAGPIVAVLCVLVLIAPSAYVVQEPGPTQDVLGKVEGKQVIDVSGVKTHKDSGKLLLVTVNASGVPGYPVTNAQALLAWANPKATVIPQEAVFPVGQSAKDYAKESNKEMSSSQSAAATAAKRFLKAHGYDVSGMKVSMHVDDIGGPSAGMMYTIGLIDKVTGEQLAQLVVRVLPAGRRQRQMCIRDSNCSDVVGHVPQGLHVVKVGTLDEAHDALVAIRDGKGGSLPQCTVKQ